MYSTHRAIPNKWDGIDCEEIGDAKYDDPAYYVQSWDDPAKRERRDTPPSLAEIADGVLYQSMQSRMIRAGLASLSFSPGRPLYLRGRRIAS
jgi:hypothetical protein